MTEDLTGYSYTELREAAAAVEREVTRREAQDEAARAEQFRTELAEIRAGTRVVGAEHVAWLSPREVEAAVNNWQVPGIAPDRRLRQR
jgi:hypothetical protein